MRVARCEECGAELAEDTETCPECGASLSDTQREELKQQAAPRRERIYVYGRRKRVLSPEARALLIVILIAVILLLICRVSHAVPNSHENVQGGVSVMPTYEYRVARMPAQATIGRFNEQIAGLIADGWAPIMMSGDTTVNILMRRALAESTPSEARQAAAVAEPVGVASSS